MNSPLVRACAGGQYVIAVSPSPTRLSGICRIKESVPFPDRRSVLQPRLSTLIPQKLPSSSTPNRIFQNFFPDFPEKECDRKKRDKRIHSKAKPFRAP